MHRLWPDILKKSSGIDLKVIVGNRNRRSARHELIRKRPKQALLKNKTIKSEYIKAIKTQSSSLNTCLHVFFNRITKENEKMSRSNNPPEST
jgi:hypothetical protein